MTTEKCLLWDSGGFHYPTSDASPSEMPKIPSLPTLYAGGGEGRERDKRTAFRVGVFFTETSSSHALPVLNPDEAVVWILEEVLRPCLTQNDYGGRWRQCYRHSE